MVFFGLSTKHELEGKTKANRVLETRHILKVDFLVRLRPHTEYSNGASNALSEGANTCG